MATYNDGRPRFARHGCKLEVGSDEYVNLVGQVEYSITFAQEEMLDEASMNLGLPKAATYVGDTRKGTFRIKLRYAQDISNANSILSIFHGSTAGAKNVEDIAFTVYDYKGAATGEQHAFSNCELAEDPILTNGSGGEADTIEYVFRHDAGKPTSTGVGA